MGPMRASLLTKSSVEQFPAEEEEKKVDMTS